MLRKIEQYMEYVIAMLLLMIFGFFLMAHWLACCWYVVGRADLRAGVHYGWIPRLFNDSQNPIAIGSVAPDNVDSVIRTQQLMVYMTALYYTLSLVTSIGFGNVSAYTETEKIVSVVFMLIGCKLVKW